MSNFNTTPISKSTKFSEVSGALANLTGVVSVQEIIDTIKQIDNMKTKTLVNMKTNASYDPNDTSVVNLDELYVDMTYQRIIRLQKLINKLKKLSGFDMYSAGVIDVAVRPSEEKFVWDGLRRCIMAGLCGLKNIKASTFTHPMNSSVSECQRQEARYFKSRNADQESMKAEEIFKSEVVYGDPKALELLKLIKNCQLDIEGLNPGGRLFGGFVEVRNNYFMQDNISNEFFVESSRIVRDVYKDETVSGYLLTGLAYLLQKNEDAEQAYSVDEIIESLEKYTSVNPKQTQLIHGRLAGNARGSIAYLIATRALKDKNGLLHSIGLDTETMDVIDAAA